LSIRRSNPTLAGQRPVAPAAVEFDHARGPIFLFRMMFSKRPLDSLRRDFGSPVPVSEALIMSGQLP
jgi:hypothetical protein